MGFGQVYFLYFNILFHGHSLLTERILIFGNDFESFIIAFFQTHFSKAFWIPRLRFVFGCVQIS